MDGEGGVRGAQARSLEIVIPAEIVSENILEKLKLLNYEVSLLKCMLGVLEGRMAQG
jgi:hypothetical protein